VITTITCKNSILLVVTAFILPQFILLGCYWLLSW